MSTSGYVPIPRPKISRGRNAHSIGSTAKAGKMKLTLKQKLRGWLMSDPSELIATEDHSVNISSQGFRLNIYGASGGTIVETTKYDRKNDENRHSLHVITDDKDLGAELSKIITMEQLR